MSSFDYVEIDCWNCEGLVKLQSKSGERKMLIYEARFVPTVVAMDLMDTAFSCPHCKKNNYIAGNHPTHLSLRSYEIKEENYDEN